MAQQAQQARGWDDAARAKRAATRKETAARKKEGEEAKERARQRVDKEDPLKIAATSFANFVAAIEDEEKKKVGTLRSRPTDGSPKDTLNNSLELHAWATGAGELIRAIEG
eukprot:gene5653-4016_t